jgi:hypothetical protein
MTHPLRTPPRRSSKVDAWPDFDPGASHRDLLILAGPSASGKTTFARALYARELGEDIRALLPPTISGAPSVDIKYPTKVLANTMPAADQGGAPYSATHGCILHYALNRLGDAGIRRLEDDAALLEMLDRTEETVTIVTIQVDRRRLASQYASRMFRAPAGAGSAGAMGGIGRLLSNLVRAADFGKIGQLVNNRFGDTAGRLYALWDTVALEIAARRRQRTGGRVRIIRIEPDLTGASRRAFRLLEASDC